MFTGIVEELGTVESFTDGVLRVRARQVLDDAKIGDSIAVNGCCLTVIEMHRPSTDAGTPGADGWWKADVSPETLSKTSLGRAQIGDVVNLERPVRVSDRLGGHIVQGHVDGVGEVVSVPPGLQIRVPNPLLKYIVVKGSITVDGVSLTVVDVLADGFTVAVIPHTSEATTLGRKQVGDPVNLEVDVTVKYVERLLQWKDFE